MKTAIKLVLIYFLMQLIGALFAGPFCLLYTYFAYGTFDMDKAGQIAVAPTMLLGFVFMGLYLWRKNYLTGDKHLYSPVSVPYLAWSLLAGMTSICIIGLLMSELTFCPICWTRHLIYCNPVGWVFSVFLFWDPYWKNCFSVVPLPRSCFADIARQRLSCFRVDIRYLSSESGSDNRCLPHRFLACLALL